MRQRFAVLADRFDLKTRYKVQNYEALRKTMPNFLPSLLGSIA